tara:strand:+ start:821 stop:1207 length:387 start_codon:yes stop_codon:yes gene_type:complete
MKNFLDNTVFRLSIFSSIYIIILILLSPFIDHLFTPLEYYEKKKDKNFEILGEIIIHIIVLTISWFYLNKYLKKFLESIFSISIKQHTSTAIDFIASIALIGLQNNLITKIKYITFEHPFRLSDIQLF